MNPLILTLIIFTTVLLNFKVISSTHNFVSAKTLYDTFYGGLKRTALSGSFPHTILSLKVPTLSEDLDVVLVTSLKKNAPLVIYIPGVMSEPLKGVTPFTIESLTDKDYHLLTIPSVISAVYLKAKPLWGKDPGQTEGIRTWQLIEEVIKKLPTPPASLHFVSESLGSITTLMAIKYSPKRYSGQFSTTMLWPPLVLHEAMVSLDQEMTKALLQIQTCSFWWRWPEILSDIFLGFKFLKKTKEDERCWGAWGMVNGFQIWIPKIAQDITGKDRDLPQSFKNYNKLLVPEFQQASDKQPLDYSILYYLETHPSDKIFVITSRDDFLNSAATIKKIESTQHLAQRFNLLEDGGHTGYLGDKNFYGLIKKNIKKALNYSSGP